MKKLDQIITAIQQGKLDTETARERLLQTISSVGQGTHLDLARTLRTGNPEVVFCEGKTPGQTASIMRRMLEVHGSVLGTRASLDHAYTVQKQLPEIKYDSASKLLYFIPQDHQKQGCIVVLSAGTSDLQIAEEAAGTAEFLGSRVIRHYDCGVAGVHRLMNAAKDFAKANAIIAVAGMDGALPTVAAGLSPVPVIGVPTSVGYGTGLGGCAALMTMLNSCAPGVSVVNIDNGFGAGYQAHCINRGCILAAQKTENQG
jgi:hypothetical protein